jgi:tetratricopeptide (TPR) repeat protein
LQSNIDEAVGDFHSALKLNPLSYTSLQNLAYVYSELKQDLPSAIESLKHLHSLRPYHAETLTALAVLYARSGHDQLAVDSVAKALEANPSAPAFFQAACAHAIMSTRNDKSLEQSFTLLSRALAGGFGHDLLESDVDLKYIRHHSQFDALLQFSRLHVK